MHSRRLVPLLVLAGVLSFLATRVAGRIDAHRVTPPEEGPAEDALPTPLPPPPTDGPARGHAFATFQIDGMV